MKTKRISLYMAFTTLCTFACCLLAAFLLFENAVHNGYWLDDVLRPLVPLLAAIVLLRHFIVLYRLRLENKRLWLKLVGILLFPMLLLAILYEYSALFNYTKVNCGLWNRAISFAYFLKQDTLGSHIAWQDWILPSAALLIVEGLYLFSYEAKTGRKVILPTWALLYSSPFEGDKIDIFNINSLIAYSEEEAPKKTVVLKFKKKEADRADEAKNGDSDNE